MSKVAWSSILAILLVASGSAFFYFQQRTDTAPFSTPTEAVEKRAMPPAETNHSDELKRRKLEGIGNTKALKPVQIPLGNAK